jgi:Bacterial PH domain
MACSVCGSEFSADALFCPKCGERRKSNPPTPKAEMAAAIPGESSGADLLRKVMSDKIASANATPEAEQPLWKGGYSAKAMIGGWILSLVVTLVACMLAMLFPFGGAGWLIAIVLSVALWGGHLAMLIYQRLSFEYELTSQRFVHRSGVLNRVTDRIEVIDIDDVQVAQTFVERFLNVGTIRLLSSDTSSPMLQLKGIDDVNRVATLIDDTRRTERRKRGVHIEAV